MTDEGSLSAFVEPLRRACQLDLVDVSLGLTRESDRDRERQAIGLAGLDLGEIDGELLSGRVVAPGSSMSRGARAGRAMAEEPGEVLPGGFLHDAAEVVGRGVAVAEAPVVVANPGPERLGADLAAEHVQRPAALLVDEAVEHLAHVGEVVVDHGEARALRFSLAKHASRGSASGRRRTRRGRRRARGRAGRSRSRSPSLSQTSSQSRLGHRVAEPLVGDLVGDEARRGRP